MIYISKIHYPVTVLGFGRRLGVWLQGCSIGCRGCISQDTWTKSTDFRMSIEALMRRSREMIDDRLDGVTISGGEPFEQPEALSIAIDQLRAMMEERGRPGDILVYSGMTLKSLRIRHSGILKKVDAIISEPFIAARAPGARLMGSSNQVLTTITPLGVARYDSARKPNEPAMQISVENGHVWMIGVPMPGAMEELESRAHDRGVTFEGVSWRS